MWLRPHGPTNRSESPLGHVWDLGATQILSSQAPILKKMILALVKSANSLHALTSKTRTVKRTEVITSESGIGWTSEMECSCPSVSSHHSQEIDNNDDEGSDGEDLMGHGRRIEDSMTEVELWQQLEHELNQPKNEEAINDEEDMVKEVREEEEEEIVAAAAEVGDNVSIEATTEMWRFFPPGKIMHIVPTPPEETADDERGEWGW